MKILPKINHALESTQDTTPRPHLGASEIGGDCARALWYKFRQVKTIKHKGRMLRLFDRGHKEEARFEEWLELAGLNVSLFDNDGEQYRFNMFGGHFAGSLDGILENTSLLEFKTSNEKWFKQLKKDGLELTHRKHFAQVHLYMHTFKLETCNYLSINKNNDEIYEEEITYDPKVAQYYIDRAEMIIFAEEPPIRIHESPAFYKCRMCDYADVCRTSTIPEKGCRTCAHVTPLKNGRWGCDYPKCPTNDYDLYMPNPLMITDCDFKAYMEGERPVLEIVIDGVKTVYGKLK